jgi:hypothetical protein
LLYKFIKARLADDLGFPVAGQDGLVSEPSIKEFVKKFGQLADDEGVRGALLIFDLVEIRQKRKQRTWLVATTQRLFCITDEVSVSDGGSEERPLGLRISWRLDKAAATPIAARDHEDQGKTRSGRVDIGPRRNWLYSKKLFASHQLLEDAIRNLRFFADRAAKKWPLRGSLKLG